MSPRVPIALMSLIHFISPAARAADEAPASRPAAERVAPELAQYFTGYRGCFVLCDLNTGEWLRFNPEQCRRRLTPCSTFKIPNALFALETGVVADENTQFKWDGKPQRRKECARDHTLASAVRDSVVWYFQRVATGVGVERMRRMLEQCDYGNRDMRAGLTEFWLVRDSLKISADEQVRFMAKLYRDELPFSRRAMDIVRRLLIQRESGDDVFAGKTGSGDPGAGETDAVGWFVGYVKRGPRACVFAVNIEAPSNCHGRIARPIAERILKHLELLDAPMKTP